MRLSLGIACVLLFVGVSNAKAVCVYGGELYAKTTVSRELANSQLVIRGTVLSNREVAVHDADEDVGVVSRIRIEKVFRGNTQKSVIYYSRRDSGGFYLDQGKDYLLFLDPIRGTEWAKDYPGAMVVNYSCGQSKLWNEVSAEDREMLESRQAKSH